MTRTRILGIQWADVENEKTGEIERKLVKPAPPDRPAIHFKSAAMRRKVQADPQSLQANIETAFYRVPVYQGMDNKTFKYLQSQHKYKQKLAGLAWQEKAKEIKSNGE